MIHELRLYEFRPGTLEHYLPLAGGVALAIRGPELGVLGGFWLARRNGLDLAVHVWQYDSLNHRQAAREALIGNPRWNNEFLRHILPMLQSQEVRFLAPAGEGIAPGQAHGSYSLLTFESAPGQLGPAVADARARLALPGRAQLYTGIAPWPNSASLLVAGDAASTAAAPPEGAVLKERIDMKPAYFSPLQ